MFRRLLILFISSLVCLSSWGQGERLCFQHLDVGATYGTTGVGVDLSMPISDAFFLRAGFAFVPHTETTASLSVLLNDEPIIPVYDAKGNRTDRMGRLSEMMHSFIGYEMDEQIDFYMVPTMWNGKVLVDWFPFEDKDWHFTAGFFVGPSSIAEACNRQYEMQSLSGINIYNGMYDKVISGKPILSIGDQSIDFPMEFVDRVYEYGRLSIPVGKREDGSVCSLEPGNDGLSKVVVRTNAFRPYLGAGYTYSIGKTSLSVDLGMMIWGGRPDIITPDGTDLSRQMQELDSDFGRWVDRYSSLGVMPVAEIRISRRIF